MPLVPLSDTDVLDVQTAPAQSQTLVPLADHEQLDAPQEYTGSIIPMRLDAQGNRHLAVPGIISGLFDTAASAVAAPGDAYAGRIQTPYTQPQTQPSNTQQGINALAAVPLGGSDPINRAIDFASVLAPTSVASRAGELVPGASIAATQTPTAQELKGAATAGYKAARESPLTVPAEEIAQMANGIQNQLVNTHGIIPETAPKTYAVLDKLANPVAPRAGESVAGNYIGLAAAREGLSKIAGDGSTEGFAAQQAIKQLDPYIDSISPTAADARANYAAAMRSNDLTGTLSRANTGIGEKAEGRGHATGGGSIDNRIRSGVESLLEKPQDVSGFSDAEIAALKDVVKGTPTQNIARKVGSALGGIGLGQMVSIGAGSLLGGHFLGPEHGATYGAMIGPAIGASAKGLENFLASRSLGNVDELVRQRSPLYQAMAQQAPIPALGSNIAGTRALLASLLGEPKSAPPLTTGMPSLAQILAGQPNSMFYQMAPQ